MRNKGMRGVKFALMILLVVILILPTSVISNASAINESDEIADTVGKYLSMKPDSPPIYDRAQAIEDGVNREALEVADQAYQIMQEMYQFETTGVRAAWPVYGNWCGPSYGSGTPIDLLDVGCKKHDQCYGTRGYHKCSCDKDFVLHINKNIGKMSGSQKTMAMAVKVWLLEKLEHPRGDKGGVASCWI